MIVKPRFIVGFAAGYVLGARAGKERYEQIKRLAARVQNDPRVQDKVETAKAQATEAAQQAKDAAQAKVEDVRSDDSGSGGTATGTTPGTAAGPTVVTSPPSGTYARTEPRTPSGERPDGLMT